MINPFPESALNDEAGKLFMEDYDSYFKKAQMITEVPRCGPRCTPAERWRRVISSPKQHHGCPHHC